MEKVRFVAVFLVLVSFFPLGSSYGQSTALQAGPPSNASARVKDEIRRLESFDPVERVHAAQALGRMGERAAAAVPYLIAALNDNARLAVRSPAEDLPFSSVAEAAMTALVDIGAPAVEPLISALGNSNPGVRRMATEALGSIRDPRTIDPLVQVLESDVDALVQATAVDALRKKDDPRAMEALVLAERHENWMVRSLAGRAVEEAGGAAAAGGSSISSQALPGPESRQGQPEKLDEVDLGEGPARTREGQGSATDGSDTAVTGEETGAPEGVEEAVHIVRKGDTLYSLGRRYGVSWQKLMARNGLHDPTELREGQVLKLPGRVGTAVGVSPQGEVLYTVQQGDNLYEIGLLYGMSWKRIAERNGISDPNQVRVGQVLRIPVQGTGDSP